MITTSKLVATGERVGKGDSIWLVAEVRAAADFVAFGDGVRGGKAVEVFWSGITSP